MYRSLARAISTAQSLKHYRKPVEIISRNDWLKILDIRDRFNDEIAFVILASKEIIKNQCKNHNYDFYDFEINLISELIIKNGIVEWYFDGANKQLGHNILFYTNIDLAFNRCAEYLIDIGVKNNQIKIKSKHNGYTVNVMADPEATNNYVNCCKAIYETMKQN